MGWNLNIFPIFELIHHIGLSIQNNSMLYFTSIAISLYLLALLTVKPNKTIADKLLMIWQLLATLHLASLYLQVSGNYLRFPYFIGWGDLLALAHGPFLYLYIFYLTKPKKFSKKQLIHFIPIALAYLLWLSFLLKDPTQKLLNYQQGFTSSYYQTTWIVTNICIVISGIAYVFAAIVLLHRYKKKIKEEFSNTEKISLNWLRYLITGIAAIWLFVIFYPTTDSIYLSASLYICFIGFFGVRQQQIFSPAVTTTSTPSHQSLPSQAPGSIPLEALPNKTKYDWSSLTEEDIQRIFIQLNEVMDQEKLYKNAELTLSKLAEILQLKDAALSQVINSKFDKSFYDYVNSLRVDECIKMIADEKNQNYTLLSIAFDCGFNSKSSFNRNFRKFTGKSPSDFFRKPNETTY